MKKANQIADIKGKEPILPITERIKTLKDVYDYHGIDSLSAVPYPNPTNDSEKWLNACQNVKLIASCLNEGMVIDLTKYNSYFPYFKVIKGGFSFCGGLFYGWGCDIPVSLLFETSEKARYAGTVFLEVYKDYITLR